MDLLVSTQWLADQMGAADLRIVDATYFLPEHQRDAAAEFQAAHIPGAVHLNLAELADLGSGLPNTLPPPEKFASRLAALGLGDGCRIIFYDDSPLHSSGRAWWMARVFGLPQVAILDGGLGQWRAEGWPVEGGPAAPRPRHLTLNPDRAMLRVKGEVADAVATGSAQIVDARGAARFAGAEPEARPGLVPGHVPGAYNLPYARLFHADGTWKRGEELHALFDEAGVDLFRPVITTCGSGVTAANLSFALALLGKPDVALYDGSWAEWGSDPALPKATGPAA